MEKPCAGDSITYYAMGGQVRFASAVSVNGASLTTDTGQKVPFRNVLAINGKATDRPWRLLRIDSREQSPELKAMADEVCLLRYENPEDPAHPYSFDIELTTMAGQVLSYERKKGWDAVSSFLKLDRQVTPCTGIILEGFNARAWRLAGKDEAEIDRVEKRLWRIAHSRAVVQTGDVHDTIRFLRYLGAKEEPVALR
jgi:hypothetical protein